jgi:hypothetical protein
MTLKEHIWHLRRHVGAREPVLVGIEVPIIGASGATDFVDNGLDIDGEAHLQADEFPRAKEIGRSLYIPADIETILRFSSPLPRAQETELYMFVGAAEKHASMNLGVDTVNLSHNCLTIQEKRILASRGLKVKTTTDKSEGLNETIYKNKQGNPDDGRELVAQAYCTAVNHQFHGYRFMLDRGFQGDFRSEHPLSVAERGIRDVLPRLLAYDMVLSVTHQPNLEAMCALLTQGLGTDGNELFANAGGPFDLGGGLQLTVYTKDEVIVGADLMRTMNADNKNKPGYTNGNGAALTTKLEVGKETLIKYATATPRPHEPTAQIGFGD